MTATSGSKVGPKGPIGLYGGTFDPIHWGHLLLAEAARDALGLPLIHFVPARIPPHKRDNGVTPPEDRLAMLSLAIAGNPAFALCRWEIEQPGPSYTVETLRHFRAEGWGPIYLLLGADSVAALDRWHEPDEIRALATLVAMARPGWSAPTGMRVLALPEIEVSSSAIRQRCQEGRSIRYWVPEAVERYIAEHRLYRRGGGPDVVE